MGLDMFLERMPRYKDATPRDICVLESYFDWKAKKKDPRSNAKKYTLKQWCGTEYKDVPNGDVRKFYESFFTVKYYDWDEEKLFGRGRITTEVGYWRKANAIHKWFVDNIQDGEDDCCYHREVTREDLEALRDVCHEVLCNPDVAAYRLPTQGGFFFGSINYGEWYMKDIRDTIDIITQVLQTTDFDKEMLFYISSW